MDIEQRLAEIGVTLPVAAAPVAAYVPWRITGRQLLISGQLPLVDGRVAVAGRLGDTVTLQAGQEAARLCAINILAQLGSACDGDWSRVAGCVKLTGFVAATPDFTDHPGVINGASELMEQALGEAGRHARAAVGVASLPLGAAVEVEAMFELHD